MPFFPAQRQILAFFRDPYACPQQLPVVLLPCSFVLVLFLWANWSDFCFKRERNLFEGKVKVDAKVRLNFWCAGADSTHGVAEEFWDSAKWLLSERRKQTW